MTRARTQPGAILLEVVLAVSIFVAAGSAILVLTGNALSGLQHTRVAEQARDLACSAMARLECGLDTPRTLSGPVKAEQGFAVPSGRWEISAASEPSQFTGLTRVTVTAKKLAGGKDDRALEASYTLRQLVRMSPGAEDTPGPDDAIAALAPAPAPAPGSQDAPAKGHQKGPVP